MQMLNVKMECKRGNHDACAVKREGYLCDPSTGSFMSKTQDSGSEWSAQVHLSVRPHGQQRRHRAHERLQVGDELATCWQRINTPKYKEPLQVKLEDLEEKWAETEHAVPSKKDG